jgi:hypothetical protein
MNETRRKPWGKAGRMGITSKRIRCQEETASAAVLSGAKGECIGCFGRVEPTFP